MKRYHYTQRDFATKEAARASLMRLLEPLKPFYSEGGARVDLGVTSTHYENDSIPMEAFARPWWGLSPFWLGGGSEPDFEDLYRRGFEHGPDPRHPEYWHTGRDYDQKFCEMAAVSYGILLTPDKIWEPLSLRGKDNLVEWLWEINRYECVASNWQWFCIITNLALKSVGRPYSQERLDFGLGLMEEYYDAGGWYHDGAGGEKDYDNPFVMVTYGLLYAMFLEGEDPERCARFRQRAQEFAREYLSWFAPDGASIAYGRSLTYRFAQGAFFAVALLAGEEVLPLACVMAMSCGTSVLASSLNGVGRQRVVAAISLLGGAVQLGFTLALVPLPGVGMAGYVAGAVVSTALELGLCLWQIIRATGLKVQPFQWMAAPGLSALLAGLVGNLLFRVLKDSGLSPVPAGVGTLAFALILY